MDFVCNVCDQTVYDCPIERIDREVQSCPHCGSTVRMRSIVHLVSIGLFGRSFPLPQFPSNKNIVGLGMSEWDGYASWLSKKFSFTNTFFHCEPFFDVAAGAGARANTCDFVISTEVFEHVAPPVSRAFKGAFDLLKAGGHFIFTVPFTLKPETTEHFPELHDYRIIQFDNDYVLVNRTKDGRYMLHQNLIFHGGPGTTLEMRVFCQKDVEMYLREAGFQDIRILGDDVPEFGIIHKHPWSLPILASRPAAA